MKRRIASLLAVLGAILAMLFMSTPAQAADSCYGSTCEGRNPSDTTCVNDAKTIAATDIGGYGMLEMRWSKACNSGWARFNTYRRSEWLGGGKLGHIYVSAWTDRGTQDSIGLPGVIVPFQGTTVWGRMVDFGRPEVCIGTRLYAQIDGETQYSPGDVEDLGWFRGHCQT